MRGPWETKFFTWCNMPLGKTCEWSMSVRQAKHVGVTWSVFVHSSFCSRWPICRKIFVGVWTFLPKFNQKQRKHAKAIEATTVSFWWLMLETCLPRFLSGYCMTLDIIFLKTATIGRTGHAAMLERPGMGGATSLLHSFCGPLVWWTASYELSWSIPTCVA